MLSGFKEKEIKRLDNLIDSYQEDINTLGKELEGVTEKYRKLIEEETKSLRDTIQYYQNEQELLFTKKRALEGDTAPADKDTTVAAIETPVDEEQIVDTIYPENNEPEEEDGTVEETPSEVDWDSAETEEPESSESSVPEGWPEYIEKEEQSEESAATDFIEDPEESVKEITEDDDIWNQPVEQW